MLWDTKVWGTVPFIQHYLTVTVWECDFVASQQDPVGYVDMQHRHHEQLTGQPCHEPAFAVAFAVDKHSSFILPHQEFQVTQVILKTHLSSFNIPL